MSLYALLDPAVPLAHTLLTALADLPPGPRTGASTALAVVALTLLIRTALLPMAVRGVRATRARAALAPELARLRERHRDDPATLARELAEAHRRAGTSPYAGVGAALAQLPFVLTLYRVVVVPVVGGAPSVLVGAVVLGAPLTAHWPQVLAGAGLLSPAGAAALVLLAGLLLLARLSGSQQAAAAADPLSARVGRLLPYGTVALAAVAPVAVGLYLLTTTAWTVAERAVLPGLV